MARVEKYKKTKSFEPVCLILETETEVKHLVSILNESHEFKNELRFFNRDADTLLFDCLNKYCEKNNISWDE